MRAATVGAVGALLVLSATACSKPPREPLLLESNRLTVHNDTADEWQNAELWLNHYFRVPVRSIPPNSSFQVGLDQFVDSYGRRFNRSELQITDVRLKAKTPAGAAVEVVMPFRTDGLSDALGGMK